MFKKPKADGGFLTNAPWQTFAIIVVMIGLFLWKIGVLDALQRWFTKSEADRIAEFDKANTTGNSTWTTERIRQDATQIAVALGRDKDQSVWLPGAWSEDEDTALDLVKNYTNPTQRNLLVTAYRDFATDGRDLKADLAKYLSAGQVMYLRQKGII